MVKFRSHPAGSGSSDLGGGGLRVAMDLRRLAEHWNDERSLTGITRYTHSLFHELIKHEKMIELIPVVYATGADANIYNLNLNLLEIQSRLNRDVYASWRNPNHIYPDLLHFLESMARPVLGTVRTQSILERLLTPQRVQRLHLRYERLTNIRRSHRLKPRRRLVHCADRFACNDQWRIYHSPYHALPPRRWTGAASRIVTIADCIDCKHPEFLQAESPSYIQQVINSIDIELDWVICMSETTKRDVQSLIPLAPDRLFVVPIAQEDVFNHPDVVLCHNLLSRERIDRGKYILAIGQPHPRKNMARLAQAWLRLQKGGSVEDPRLVIVTTGRHWEEVEKQLGASGASSGSITILTEIDDPMLASLYANAMAFVYPSLHEGFGLPPLEAMAAGCPVVVSEGSSVAEVVGEAGRYVDPASVESIAAGIRGLIDNQSLRDKMIALGRAHARGYSWQRTVMETLECYRVVDSHHGKKI